MDHPPAPPGRLDRRMSPPVHLREADLHTLIRVCQESCPDLQCLSLFGSRTGLSKKGGDIDLWLELSTTPAEPGPLLRRPRRRLYDGLGEQKSDRQISGPGSQITDVQQRNFYELILPTLVVLWTKSPSP